MPGEAVRVPWAGEDLDLLPERALYWPRRRTLVVSDPHFGKAAAFQHAGLPVPDGTPDDVARLDRLIQGRPVARLVILGDLFHARSARTPRVMEAVARWRGRHPLLEVTLVRGNHDLHAGDPPGDWRFRCVAGPEPDPPFEYRHEPADPASKRAGFVLAGHVHPAVVLSGRDGSRLRLPCFHLGDRQAILPAFGSFTGNYRVRPGKGERVFVVGENRVAEIVPS